MWAIRRHFALIVGGWLACQILALAMAVSISAAVGPVLESPCVCPRGAAQACPMHKAAAAKSPVPCSYHSAANPAALAMASLFGPIAVLTRPIDITTRFDSGDSIHSIAARAVDRLALPDAPPPRT